MMKWSKAVFRQYIATFSCLLCSVMTSVCFVWYTPLMVRLLKPDNNEIEGLDNDQMSWLIAIIEVGELLGPIPCGFIADRWGRKPSLLLSAPLCLVSWLITYLTRSLIALYVARILQGIAIAIIYTIAPIYIAEIAHPDIRGELGGHLQTTWFLGVLYSYATGPYLSYANYIIVSTVPVFLFFACFLFVPETPYFYMLVEKRKEAEESLTWLRGDEEVTGELKSIEDAISVETFNEKSGQTNAWRDLLFSKKCRKPLIVLTIICLIKYIGGTTTITNFATQTFSKTDPDHADLIAIGMALVLTITSISAAFVADIFGRKPLILLSTLGLGISSSIVAVYYYLESNTSIDVSNKTWILYVGFAAYCITFNIGLGPVQTTLQSEYFPTHVRGAAGGYVTITSNFMVFISIKQYQLLDDHVGVYSNFVVFAVVSFLGLICLAPYMEETAKKSLGQIQNN